MSSQYIKYPGLSIANISGVLPVANGGTNSSTTLNNNRIMQSSSDKIVEAAAITAARALVSDANGIPVAATTTTTELNFVNGVTSAIQTQINTKAASSLFTNWAAATTPVFTGFGTVSANTAFSRRFGDCFEMRGVVTLGTTAASIATISLPSLTVDTSKLTATRTALLGSFFRATGTGTDIPAVGNGPWVITFKSSDTATLVFSIRLDTASGVFVEANGTNIGSSGNVISYSFSVPVTQYAF